VTVKELGADIHSVKKLCSNINQYLTEMRKNHQSAGFCTKYTIDTAMMMIDSFEDCLNIRQSRHLSCGRYATYTSMCPKGIIMCDKPAGTKCKSCLTKEVRHEKSYYLDQLKSSREHLESLKRQDGKKIGSAFNFEQILDLIKKETIGVEVGIIALKEERQHYANSTMAFGYQMMQLGTETLTREAPSGRISHNDT